MNNSSSKPFSEWTDEEVHDALVKVPEAAWKATQQVPRSTLLIQPVIREARIRAIVGQQWAVAIASMSDLYRGGGNPSLFDRPHDHTIENLAALPCAVDIVDGGES